MRAILAGDELYNSASGSQAGRTLGNAIVIDGGWPSTWQKAIPDDTLVRAPDNISVMIARTAGHISHVCRLVNKCYKLRGYAIHADPHTPFPDAERAAYFIPLLAFQHGIPVGTVTLGLDSPRGLLVDEVNRREVDVVRECRSGVCEVVRLAVDNPLHSKGVLTAILEALYRLGSALCQLSDLFIEVNPRHAPLYVRLFGFEVLAAKRTCVRVKAPSVLLRLTREELEKRLLANGKIDLGTWRTSQPQPRQASECVS